MGKNLSAFVLILVAAVTWAPAISLATSFFNVDSAGNVGVGNTDPQHKLDVSGAIYSRIATTTSSVDWNSGNVQQITLSSNTTFTFANGQAGGEYKLILTQDGTGGRTVTWPANVKWSGGTAPTLTSYDNSIDVVSFTNNGSSYLGSFAANYLAPASPSVCESIGSTGTTGPDRFGQSGADNDHPFAFGDPFVASNTETMSQIKLRLRTFGSPTDNVQVKIESDGSGAPSGTVLGTASIAAGSLTSTFTDYTVNFDSSVSVSNGVTYWVVGDRSGTGSNTDAFEAGYDGSGSSSQFYYSGAWHARGAGLTHYSRLYCQ